MTTPISRRRFLQSAAVGAAAMATTGITTPAFAGSRRIRGRQTVAVFGGGIAGLTAAHELAERGFDVTVYERRAWGAKARSHDVPTSASANRKPLPGEHGFRVFFGFYQSVPDTMRRIPFGSNPNGVFDNLVGVPELMLAREGRRELVVPWNLDPRAATPTEVRDTIIGLCLETDLPPQAAAYFADRMVVYLSSCDARRMGQWDNTPWSDFVAADHFTNDYRRIVAELFTRFAQASRADRTSTQFVGKVFECVLYNLLGRNNNGPLDRVLDLPTSEAFINPWIAHLASLGVTLRVGYAIESFDMRGGRIAGATVRGPSGSTPVRADWYVCAPASRAGPPALDG